MKDEGCGRIDLVLTLYTKTQAGRLLPPVSGFANIQCGFEPLMYKSDTYAILLCEECAAKNGYRLQASNKNGASWLSAKS